MFRSINIIGLILITTSYNNWIKQALIMQIRADNLSKSQNSHELLALIFKLITTIKKNANESWCLIDEVPEKYLTNGLLVLEEMNFTIFGFHLHDINFRNCKFN